MPLTEISLASGEMSARISPRGAELTSLRHARLGELLWQATDDRWRRQAPVLFPIIGRCPPGIVCKGGQFLDLPTHGFAPERHFTVTRQSATACEMVLCDDAETASAYPYRFRLTIDFSLDSAGLSMAMEVHNPSTCQTLPYMLGGHPGFAWPLPQAGAAEEHRLWFSHDEPEVMQVLPQTADTMNRRHKIIGRSTDPSAMDFHGLTHVLAPAHSDTVTFGTRNVQVALSFDGFRNLAFWRRDDAPFLCIEPWTNLPITVSAPTRLEDLRDITQLGPQQSQSYRICFSPGGARLCG